MPGTKRKRKAYNKNASFKRWQNIKMRALPVDMMVLCGPIDSFFKNIEENGQVDEVHDKAIFDDRWFDRYIGVASAGVGFVDALEILSGIKNEDSKNLIPLKALFADIDSGKEFTADEVGSAFDSWQWAKRMIGNSTLAEITIAIDDFHTMEKANANQ